MTKEEGVVVSVAGPVVKANRMSGSRMYDVVRVGEERLIGEIIQLRGDTAVIQVYEETSGLAPGGQVEKTYRPLSVLLGPGLISMIYDGIQRPLDRIKEATGDFIARGVDVDPLDRTRRWAYVPKAVEGEEVEGGDVLGIVQETAVVEHRVMVPPTLRGRLVWTAGEGRYTIDDVVAHLETGSGTEELRLAHYWPVRQPRPVRRKLDPTVPLLTGQRILDTFFPIAKGGTAAIPGGFGTGKTVTQHQLAKWCDAEVIVYVGCGERGNEMTDVLTEFPGLEDPRTGEPLMKRTVLIANTSNMPVAAREASIYTGITLAEYYRDMGYHIALMADSTSRWAEALREISGRLEEMPGEEGYPAYLASRLAEFYERAGLVETCGTQMRQGSVSVIGAVSPPGGDFSEPVTQNTLRIVKVFWALDADLADRRHFPSINWLKSYSLYIDQVEPWWADRVGSGWAQMRRRAMALLQKEAELKEIIQLVGPDALPPREQATLEAARAIREDFLQQNAFHEVDTFCPAEKQYRMMEVLMAYDEALGRLVSRGGEVAEAKRLDIYERIGRMATVDNRAFEGPLAQLKSEIARRIGGEGR